MKNATNTTLVHHTDSKVSGRLKILKIFKVGRAIIFI